MPLPPDPRPTPDRAPARDRGAPPAAAPRVRRAPAAGGCAPRPRPGWRGCGPGATGMQTEAIGTPRMSSKVSSRPSRSYSRRRVPAFQLDDELDALRGPRRGDPEEIAHVDQADAAQLHVVARQRRTGADDDGAAAPADVDDVVRDEAVAEADQLEGALALADAALPHHQHAEAEHVDEDAVARHARRQQVVEQRAQLGEGDRRRQRGAQQRHLRLVGGLDQAIGRLETLGDDDAGVAAAEDLRDRRLPGVGVQARGEEAHFALPEDEHALGLQRRVEAGQRQPRLLRVGIADRPIEAGPPGQDLELDTGGDRCPYEGIDGHASNLVGHADVLAARRG